MRNLRKTRGVVDPYTLGFIISIIGSITAHAVHSNDQQSSEQAESETTPTELVIVAPDEYDPFEEALDD